MLLHPQVEKLTEEMRAKSCTQIFGMEDDWAPASFLQKMEDGRMENNRVGWLTYMEWKTIAGWWFQTFFIFHFIYGIILPNH